MRSLKVREVLKLLADDGGSVDRTSGSHRQLKHPAKPGTVTVAGKASADVDRGTLRRFFRQAGLPWPPP